MDTKYCVKCGKEMPANSEYCPNCGAKQDGTTAQNVTINNYGSKGPGNGTKKVIGSSHPAGMLEAYITFWKKYVDFSTTSSRSEYWFVVLWQTIIGFVGLFAFFLGGSIGANTDNYSFSAFIAFILLLLILYGIACIIPNVALTARRLRDAGIGSTGIILLIIGQFVPFLNFVVQIAIFVISLMPSVEYE